MKSRSLAKDEAEEMDESMEQDNCSMLRFLKDSFPTMLTSGKVDSGDATSKGGEEKKLYETVSTRDQLWAAFSTIPRFFKPAMDSTLIQVVATSK